MTWPILRPVMVLSSLFRRVSRTLFTTLLKFVLTLESSDVSLSFHKLTSGNMQMFLTD